MRQRVLYHFRDLFSGCCSRDIPSSHRLKQKRRQDYAHYGGAAASRQPFLSLHLTGNVSSFPKPLTAEEEKYYVARLAEGDPEARAVLIERNLRLVAHIMKKYYTQAADQDDLISIGTIGLIKGISSYDPSKGARLATYAARCIENAILS